ncbi:Ig-like domain-containing protein [Brevibacillus dissolubilis]|uniref:Ig-like domain-containing protein n=1 Tax=Brevibacillus dissolubilis TaxID=1844116 RepID=UPI0011172356|nr:Ig-like domain-containing protein [Brevibacillus dissolubilis]
MKNKKLLLSVLSTALVSSMTSAAFAHPQAGIYIGGEVAKFYSLDAYLSDANFDVALDEMIADPSAALFVDENGYVANIYDLLTAEDAYDALHFGTTEDFDALGALDGFTSIDEEGNEGDIYDPVVDVELPGVDTIEVTASGDNELTVGDANDSSLVLSAVAYDADGNEVDAEFTFETSNAAVATVDANGKVEAKAEGTATITVKSGDVSETFVVKVNPAATLQVTGVSALNAKEIQVKFNKPVDETSGSLAFSYIADASSTPAVGFKFVDAQTVVITPNQDTVFFDGEYALTFSNFKDLDGKVMASYSTVVKVADTVRPTVAKVEYKNWKEATVTFSEPIKSLGTVSSSDESKVSSQTALTLSADRKTLTVNLTNADANTDYTLSFIGAVDYKDNFISPNPVTVTVKKVQTETVPPAIVSVTPVNDKSFKVTFTEKLSTTPAISVEGFNGTVDIDGTNNPEYLVTLESGIEGLQKVLVAANYEDFNGNKGGAYSQLVTFAKDKVAPTVDSTRVEKIDGKEHLVVVFNENVDVTNLSSETVTVKGKLVSNYVETDVEFANLVPVAYGTAKNAIAISLNGFAPGAYTVSLTGTVNDLSLNNFAQKDGVTFTRTADTDLSEGSVTAIGYDNLNTSATEADNNVIYVSFDKVLDAASALNVANYTVEGTSAVQSAIFVKNSVTTDGVPASIVKLTLKPGTFNLSGERLVTVKDVKTATGVVIPATTKKFNFVENVAPTIASAVVTSADEITITFSESMNGTSITDSAADFGVFVDGQDWATVAGATYGTVTEIAGATDKVYVLKLGRALTAEEYAKNIQIKPATTIDATDAKGNKLSFTSQNVTRN